MYNTVIEPQFLTSDSFQHLPADKFPTIHPIDWLTSHFAVGGWSPLSRISGMLTAHMTRIAPRNGFTWHPHRGLEIYTWVIEGTLYHEDTTGGKGEIHAGELQRMFSGDWIEHQELNLTDEPARVIQIWYAADPKHRGLDAHYQQSRKNELPKTENDTNAVTHTLIGGDSPMEQHMNGRLTATTIAAGGKATIETPKEDEDLFLYITDGAGQATHNGKNPILEQYDVIIGTPELTSTTITAGEDEKLDYLSFYLPKFLTD